LHPIPNTNSLSTYKSMPCGRLPSFYLAVESLKKHRNSYE
jgi:hypothetical protein